MIAAFGSMCRIRNLAVVPNTPVPLGSTTVPPGGYPDEPPLTGEHNEAIYCGELGLQRTELAYLAEAGVI